MPALDVYRTKQQHAEVCLPVRRQPGAEEDSVLTRPTCLEMSPTHRAVHEEGYQVDRQPDGELRFRRPDGRPLPEVPPPLEVLGDPSRSCEHSTMPRGLP